jgi:hypothetical protein
MREAQGPIFPEVAFAPVVVGRGRLAAALWRLALVTIRQAVEGGADRQTAAAVRSQIDWT